MGRVISVLPFPLFSECSFERFDVSSAQRSFAFLSSAIQPSKPKRVASALYLSDASSCKKLLMKLVWSSNERRWAPVKVSANTLRRKAPSRLS